MNSKTTEFEAILPGIPAGIREVVVSTWSRFCDRLLADNLEIPKDAEFLENLSKVWVASQFVADFSIRSPASLLDLENSGSLSSSDRSASYRRELCQFEFHSEDDLMRELRVYRNREMTRIAWRDIIGVATLDETLRDCSLLAEACLNAAVDFLYSVACARNGVPTLRNGSTQQLVVLGMGKLGAWELNFSSDIDLIFAFEEEGVLPGRGEKSYSEFFTGLCRNLIRVIGTVTSDGFVFRVDVRLRPFGDSGPLVMSFDAMANYYQRQAREWERYAFIKVRPVAGDVEAGARLEAILKPFVYRRYLDYGSFAELRNLKSKITQELQRKDRMENIKLGPGGIREIEFIGQAFQLIRGGHDASLQERRILQVLKVIGSKSLLPKPVVEKLHQGYEFLRKVENRLQEFADQQVHDLPDRKLHQLRIALALGYESWNEAKQEIDRVREQVQSIFEQVFVSPQTDNGQGDAQLVWAETGDCEQITHALQRLGYQEISEVLEGIDAFRHSLGIRKLSAAGASTLDALMPLLLGAVGVATDPDDVLKKILTLIESIASRKVYLALLVENPLALSQLVKLAAASSWIVGFIGQYPLLLDELLDPRTLYSPLSRQALLNEIDNRFGAIKTDDLERQMVELRQFKQAHVLRVAAADIVGAISVSTVSDYLTDIAEVVLEKVLLQAWRSVAEKHGTPPGTEFGKVSSFAIIGYGKLGGWELGYGSDLDLVFLYADVSAGKLTNGRRPVSCLQFYARVGQRIINLLDTKMLSGRLYEVDMRLRPSGNSGLLVSNIGAFERYQLNQAWTWEHQSLVRARFVVGDISVGKRFNAVRAEVLTSHRDLPRLRKDVAEMRKKMRENLATREVGSFDLKQGKGGIADIEFIVQFGVLLHAPKNRDLLEFSDTVRLLDIFPVTGFINRDDAELLKRAYLKYRGLGHRAALQERRAVVSDDKYQEIRTRVEQLWLRLMG